MTKINTVANNGLTIVENYNKLLEQFRKTKTIDDVRILVASAKDFISVYDTTMKISGIRCVKLIRNSNEANIMSMEILFDIITCVNRISP